MSSAPSAPVKGGGTPTIELLRRLGVVSEPREEVVDLSEEPWFRRSRKFAARSSKPMRTRVSVAPRARGISTSSRPTVPGRSTFSARCRPTPQPGIPDVLLSLASTYRP